MTDVQSALTREEELFAALLSIIDMECASMEAGELNSWALLDYNRAMQLLAKVGFIAIKSQVDNRILAEITPQGSALLERLSKQEKSA
jgi:flagellar biosynthesis/type III secretory pathway chaperone